MTDLQILCYLQTTTNQVLLLSADGSETLHGYFDSDWAGYVNDRKSTLGQVHFTHLLKKKKKMKQVVSKSLNLDIVRQRLQPLRLFGFAGRLMTWEFPSCPAPLYIDSDIAKKLVFSDFFTNILSISRLIVTSFTIMLSMTLLNFPTSL